MLTQHLSVEIVSIIVDDSKCDLDFANSLADEIRKKRAEEYSSVFEIRVYKISYIKTDSVPEDILQSIQKENLQKRAFIMLTAAEITSAFFEASSKFAMNGLKDIWIAKYNKYNYKTIPFQTMTFSQMTYKEYQPVDFSQDVLLNSNEILESICSTSSNFSGYVSRSLKGPLSR